MAKDYFKSEAGIAAFREVGLPYEDELWDENFAKFQKTISKGPAKDRKMTIANIQRLVLPTGEQYIIHDERHQGIDILGNRKRFYKSGTGMYPVPIPKYEIKMNTETFEKENLKVGLETMERGYSIPFTVEKADELHKLCDESTTYTICKGYYRMGNRIKVDTFEDFRDGEPDDLLRWGHRASAYEKQVMADERAGKVQLPPTKLYG